MADVKVNSVLWRMKGTRQNDKITWEAVPKMVKSVEKYMYRFYGGGGVSHNGVGQLYFPSKEECEEYWLKNHKLEEYIHFDDPTPEGVDEYPRTDWETYEVSKFDCVDSAAVYQGGLDRLVNITDEIAWHKDSEHVADYGLEVEYLTLHEISEQAKTLFKYDLLTVIIDDPMKSKIFQWGNYGDKWVFLGDVQGYA